MRYFLIHFLLILFISCTNKKKSVDVSNVSVDVQIDRFDVDFYNATSKTLSSIKRKYPMFFPHQIDSVWLNKINNKDEQTLFIETQKVYEKIDFLKDDLEYLFKHVKHYNQDFKSPKVTTMLTNIDYDNRVVYNGDHLLISLDAYLGKDHEFYNDYPKYIKQNNTKSHIIVDAANAIVDKQIKPNRNRKFLDKMIAYGKKMYLLDTYLPSVHNHLKIGFTKEKYDWAESHEEDVWRYFIDKDLLYSTDAKLNQRFLNIAPFSKFYLSMDNESPGRIGVYIGWQIVKAFMRNNDVSLQALMQMSEEEIFQKSKYKPKR